MVDNIENTQSNSNDSQSESKPRELSPNKQDPTNIPEKSKVEVKIDYFVINVFFDGTWNNMFNNNLYRLQTPSGKVKTDLAKKGLSYHREATGVEWLYKGYKVPDKAQSADKNMAVYVEGTGTWDDKKDSDVSAGSGWGKKYGMVGKVNRAFELINEQLSLFKKLREAEFDFLRINVYGFSRGSASARLFTNRIRQEAKKLKFDKQLRNNQVQIGFVGIMDTVVSMGFNQGNDAKKYQQRFDFENDVIAESADISNTSTEAENQTVKTTEPRAYKVVHIVAQDEARTYFSLYNIQSAIDKGYGLEFSIPGCHTDIGGGLGVDEKYDTSATDQTAINNSVVVTGRDEQIKYVTEVHNLDEYGRFERGPEPVFNNEGTFDKPGLTLFDNVITNLLAQLQAASQVDAEKMAEYMVDKGYYQSYSKVAHKDPSKDFPVSKANQANESLVLVDQSSDRQMKRQLIGYRHQLETGYPRIPCNIMLAFTERYNEYYFEKFIDVSEAQVPAPLKSIFEELKGKAFALDDQCKGKPKGLSAALTIDDPTVRRHLYNRYIHWAGSGLMDYQLHQNGRSERTILQGRNHHQGDINEPQIT